MRQAGERVHHGIEVRRHVHPEVNEVVPGVDDRRQRPRRESAREAFEEPCATDPTQQYGLALAFSVDQFRGEVMGIAGTFQVHPDDYRERGYSAFVEWAPVNTIALGASTQVTHANRDIVYNVTNYFQADGLFARVSPYPELVLMGEFDFVYQSLTWNGHRGGYASFLQADVEPTRGLHFMATGELMNGGGAGEASSFDGWLSSA